ncbi:hypothetical protein GOBAR_AA15104 [Gossypium barbadense]|uniref:Bulb-type lectin domain-containing protein n=1 Tax=Gossypium barbadense TaxID=3634 RepID=A0A2P5XQF5_GOSBA|nr:hypothetical protein GOBAR_AA15104 [Gossypium barbadense]
MSLLSFSFLLLFAFSAKAVVPPSETFRFVNEGEFGPFIVEYGADYRVISIANAPFQLAFYNTTPNAFTLALRMATTRSESLFRWVWEANRGNPVRENATFSLGTDGNLVLADADGRIAWQSNTANKGVVGFQLLPNGNMVLHDSNGKFIWQSFDHPTDTLLVGQSLRAGGATKLVSRASAQNNVNGAYSLVMEPKQLVLQYKGMNSPKPLVYFKSSVWPSTQDGTLQTVTLNVEETNDGFAYDVLLDYTAANSAIGTGNLILIRPKYNSTLSILRLGIDGNLRVFTYYDKVDSQAWEETFTLFSRDSIWGNECELPERCGNFGLCEENQCVACPSPNGLLGWSQNSYSLVMEPKQLVLQYKGMNSPKPLVYFKSSVWPSTQDGTLQTVTLNVEETNDGFAYDVLLDYTAANSAIGTGNLILIRPKYNSTLSILRLGIDGNLRVFTYYDKVDSQAWEETFTLFSRDSIWGNECELPERCGNFGLCEENQCVACPSPNGLLGWSQNCQPKKVNCRPNDFSYYKLEGVNHFMSQYNEGEGIKESDCGRKCTSDCKCLGYFYHRETSKCWIANELKTLAKTSNSSHVGYIKAPNK